MFITLHVFLMNFMQVDGELDDLHIKAARFYGVVFAGSGLYFFLTRDTRDGTVPISIMTSKVFVSWKALSYYFAEITNTCTTDFLMRFG